MARQTNTRSDSVTVSAKYCQKVTDIFPALEDLFGDTPRGEIANSRSPALRWRWIDLISQAAREA